MKGDLHDPKALIREAYNIPGIRPEECRTIFLDWALSFAADADHKAHLAVLVERHAKAVPEHPMSEILIEGLEKSQAPKRRGGRMARARH